MDYGFFGTNDAAGLLPFSSGEGSTHHGTTRQKGPSNNTGPPQHVFEADCAQCLENHDMDNRICHSFSECYQDCASPCTGGDDCDLPQACYNEDCDQTDMCETQPCGGVPPCKIAPCNDTSCPEGPRSYDTTCYGVNCFMGTDNSGYSFAHSVPQICPPGQLCQGFVPGLSMEHHGQHFQQTAFTPAATGFQSQFTWLNPAIFPYGLQQGSNGPMFSSSRESKRRRVDNPGTAQATYPMANVAPLSNTFQPNLTNHLLQSHFGSGIAYPCGNTDHDDVWLNETLLQLGFPSDLSDHLLQSHLGPQVPNPCSNNDHNEIWLNQTLQQLGQTSSALNLGCLPNMFGSVKHELNPTFTPLPYPQQSPTASPGTLATPSTITMSDMAIFSEDDLENKEAANHGSAATTPEEPPPETWESGKTARATEEPSKQEFDPICRWIIDGPSGSAEKYPICGKSFDSPEDLDKHVRTVHVAVLSKTFACHWLGCQSFLTHDFRHRGKLLRHIRGAHSHFHENVCQHLVTTDSGDVRACGRTFCTKEQLKNHETKHTGERQYVCSYPGCTHRSATKTQHKTHERTHSGEKPYVCPVPGCDHRSGDSSNLSKHVRNRHPDYGQRGKGGGKRKRTVSVVKVVG